MNLVRAPMVIGSMIAGTLGLVALVEALLSRPRWDDHLLVAIGVLGAALFVCLALRLTTAVFRPPPGLPERAKFIRVVSLIAFVLLTIIAISALLFINSMSFV